MKVSELVTLKIENINLKLTLLQTQAQGLVRDRERVIDEARVSLNVPEGWLYNADACEFVEPKA